jgi:dipicolinate synthase subunit B
MTLAGKNIGIAITGSFCTYDKLKTEIEKLLAEGANVYPIFSYHAQSIDCRFGKAEEFMKTIGTLTGHEPITTIDGAEPIGPKNMLDILLVAPCTGNTLAKLNCAVTDTPVLMAAKAHIRNNKPLVIAVSTNDALGMSFKNIGQLFNIKNYYFVPFGQDHFETKPNSMVAHMDLIIPTLQLALEGKQIQPVICEPIV